MPLSILRRQKNADKSGAKARKSPRQRRNIFPDSDELLPVITLMLYYGAEKWTAPHDLYDMLMVDEEILPFVDNYRLHLIAPAEIADEDFRKFHTELRLALKYVKYLKIKHG